MSWSCLLPARDTGRNIILRPSTIGHAQTSCPPTNVHRSAHLSNSTQTAFQMQLLEGKERCCLVCPLLAASSTAVSMPTLSLLNSPHGYPKRKTEKAKQRGKQLKGQRNEIRMLSPFCQPRMGLRLRCGRGFRCGGHRSSPPGTLNSLANTLARFKCIIFPSHAYLVAHARL